MNRETSIIDNILEYRKYKNNHNSVAESNEIVFYNINFDIIIDKCINSHTLIFINCTNIHIIPHKSQTQIKYIQVSFDRSVNNFNASRINLFYCINSYYFTTVTNIPSYFPPKVSITIKFCAINENFTHSNVKRINILNCITSPSILQNLYNLSAVDFISCETHNSSFFICPFLPKCVTILQLTTEKDLYLPILSDNLQIISLKIKNINNVTKNNLITWYSKKVIKMNYIIEDFIIHEKDIRLRYHIDNAYITIFDNKNETKEIIRASINYNYKNLLRIKYIQYIKLNKDIINYIITFIY